MLLFVLLLLLKTHQPPLLKLLVKESLHNKPVLLRFILIRLPFLLIRKLHSLPERILYITRNTCFIT